MTSATPVDIDGAIAWLKALFRHSEGWVNLWSPGARATPAWAPADQLDSLRSQVERLGERDNLYFGAALRRERLVGGRGGRAECSAIPGLWLDVDWQSEVHRNPALPASEKAAVSLGRAFKLEPSAVVWTGWGFQAWWLFAEALSAVDAEPLLARWGATWDRFASEQGVEIDHVWNIDRVMRLPGSVNRKRDPRPVTVAADWSRVYQPSEFDDILDALPVPVERNGATTAHLAGSQFNALIPGGDVLAQAGWVLARTDRNGDQHWHHNGSSNDVSATVYFDDNRTCVWSDTVAAVTGCPTREPLKSWALYTYLVHRGDFPASRLDILERGFKDLQPPPAPAVKADLPALRIEQRALSDVKESDVIWLWEPWIPLGKISSIFGPPGVGKSTVALDIGARLTRGLPMPDGSGGGEPGAVILLSAEDDPEDTITRRFRAAGGDLTRARLLGDFRDPEDGIVPFTLPTHVDELGYQIADVREKLDVSMVLLIIDVLNAYIDDRVDTNADSKVRRALRPLQDMVRASRAAVLVVRHPRKGGGSATEAGGGSIGFTGSFRSEMVTGYHPENEEVRVLAVAKNNLAAKPKALSYQLMPVAEMRNKYARVVWGGEVEISADQLTDPSLTPRERDAPAVNAAREMIRDLLPHPGQGMWVLDFERELLEKKGVSKATLRRARDKEGLRTNQKWREEEGEQARNAYWIRRPVEGYDH